MLKKINILAILPVSIGGRLTTKSIIDGFNTDEYNVFVFDELKERQSICTDILENNDINYILGYAYSAVRCAQTHKLNIKTINYFSDVIQSAQSVKNWRDYYPLLKEKNNYTFYWDKTLCEKESKKIKNICYLPHFVNTEVYKPLNIEKKYDILFAGRLDTDYRLNLFLDLMKSNKNKKFAWYAIERHFRDALLRADIYDKDFVTSAYKGFIETEDVMAQKLNEAKIVINFHSQGESNVNYRTFQAMACGNVVISDYRKEMDDLFTINEDIITYDTTNELKYQINDYLDNEQKFKIISKNAVNTIQEKYNSQIGVKKMMDYIILHC